MSRWLFSGWCQHDRNSINVFNESIFIPQRENPSFVLGFVFFKRILQGRLSYSLNSVVLQTSWLRRPGCPGRRWTAGSQSAGGWGITWRRLYWPWLQRTWTAEENGRRRCRTEPRIESRTGRICAPLLTRLPSPRPPPPPPLPPHPCSPPPPLTHRPCPRRPRLPSSRRPPPPLPRTLPSSRPPWAPSPSPVAPSPCSER